MYKINTAFEMESFVDGIQNGKGTPLEKGYKILEFFREHPASSHVYIELKGCRIEKMLTEIKMVALCMARLQSEVIDKQEKGVISPLSGKM